MISTVCGPYEHKIVINIFLIMFATVIYLLLYLAGCQSSHHSHGHQKHKLHVQEIRMQLSRYQPHSLLHRFVLVIKFDFSVCKIVNESGWAMSGLFFGKCSNDHVSEVWSFPWSRAFDFYI